jgi:hypothetical protein
MEADGQIVFIPGVETYETASGDDVVKVTELYPGRGTGEQFSPELKTKPMMIGLREIPNLV